MQLGKEYPGPYFFQLRVRANCHFSENEANSQDQGKQLLSLSRHLAESTNRNVQLCQAKLKDYLSEIKAGSH